MADKKIRCSECGTEIGGDTGVDIYRHTITCFNLPDRGRREILEMFEGREDEYARRIVANLKAMEE